MHRDRRGRRRQPDQSRGLRPMHPVLPEQWDSRAVRVAMSEADWGRLEALVRRIADDESTQARAYGAALSYLMLVESATRPEPGPLDWLDWERRKAMRTIPLLRTGA